MAALPSQEGLAKIQTIKHVWEWAGVKKDLLDIIAAEFGEVALVREWATVEEDDLTEIIDRLYLAGTITVIQKGRIRSSWRCAQAAVGMDPDEKRKREPGHRRGDREAGVRAARLGCCPGPGGSSSGVGLPRLLGRQAQPRARPDARRVARAH